MLCVPLRRVRAGELRWEKLLYELKAGPAASGRPPAGNDTTVTGAPASPSAPGQRWPRPAKGCLMRQYADQGRPPSIERRSSAQLGH